VRVRALGKRVDVYWTVGQQIGKLELRGSTDAATLPMIVDDPEDLLLRRHGAHVDLFLSG
jgi:hypothetical protein